MKENADVCAPVLTNIYNNGVVNDIFPNKMQEADIAPIFKKDRIKKKDATNVENYRPVSVLQSTSKIFERIMQGQIYEYISGKLSPCLCGYRKGYTCFFL